MQISPTNTCIHLSETNGSRAYGEKEDKLFLVIPNEPDELTPTCVLWNESHQREAPLKRETCFL